MLILHDSIKLDYHVSPFSALVLVVGLPALFLFLLPLLISLFGWLEPLHFDTVPNIPLVLSLPLLGAEGGTLEVVDSHPKQHQHYYAN